MNLKNLINDLEVLIKLNQGLKNTSYIVGGSISNIYSHGVLKKSQDIDIFFTNPNDFYDFYHNIMKCYGVRLANGDDIITLIYTKDDRSIMSLIRKPKSYRIQLVKPAKDFQNIQEIFDTIDINKSKIAIDLSDPLVIIKDKDYDEDMFISLVGDTTFSRFKKYTGWGFKPNFNHLMDVLKDNIKSPTQINTVSLYGYSVRNIIVGSDELVAKFFDLSTEDRDFCIQLVKNLDEENCKWLYSYIRQIKSLGQMHNLLTGVHGSEVFEDFKMLVGLGTDLTPGQKRVKMKYAELFI